MAKEFEPVEVAHLVSASGVHVTVAAVDEEHYLSVGFLKPDSAADTDTETEPGADTDTEAEKPNRRGRNSGK